MGFDMDITKTIKRLILEKGYKQIEIAEKLGITKSNFNNLIHKTDFKLFNDIVKIANAIGYDVKISFVDQDTGKIIDAD